MILFSKPFKALPQHSARSQGSGGLDVLATPSLVAFMKNVAYDFLEKQLDAGQTSVGIGLDLEHLAPTKIGRTIKVNLLEHSQEGRKNHFSLEAFDGDKRIGKALHTRVCVDHQRFLEQLILNKNQK